MESPRKMDYSREQARDIHSMARTERLQEHKPFLLRNLPTVRQYMIDGKEIDAKKIHPVLKPVIAESEEEMIFRWWNLTWWSLPYERAYGRQMRYIVWDEHHNAPMGLIGLQSPILRWKARDEHLRISPENRDYWINQSLSAQRLGALPPYNYLLGGKLVGMLLTSNTIRNDFQVKYQNKQTIIKNRMLPARLLFMTTTGAFGKSSVYNRLKFGDHEIVEYIGTTKGSGTFHIPDNLYDKLVGYLASQGIDTKRGYGSGPSTKMRLINQALAALGIKHGSYHGIQRAVYLFPLASNLDKVITDNAEPLWYNHEDESLANFWMKRWAVPRSEKNSAYKSFKTQSVIDAMYAELD